MTDSNHQTLEHAQLGLTQRALSTAMVREQAASEEIQRCYARIAELSERIADLQAENRSLKADFSAEEGGEK